MIIRLNFCTRSSSFYPLNILYLRSRVHRSYISRPSLPSLSSTYLLRYYFRTYFTNGEGIKKDNPYAILGLQWGDGATTAEIRQAFREKAKSLHPDVVDRTVMSLQEAHEQFQTLVRSYEILTKNQNNDNDNIEEWRVSLWRQSDRIALDRTDVAGVARKRPAKPAQTSRNKYGRELGHPSGKGISRRKEEYLPVTTDDTTSKMISKNLRSSSVGRGRSKWGNRTKTQQGGYKKWLPFTTSNDNNPK
mmetsp:Transcript_44593/g.45235  ORF Transcript_44593/g.45235 Transcript_44593/m.45235 type:complete len:247 (+) Transcript_44593:219-959(+)